MNLNARSPYQDPSVRKKEIQAQAQAIPQEPAVAYVIERLDSLISSPHTLTPQQQEELLRLVGAIAVENIKQGQAVDYRLIGAFKAEYAKALGDARMSLYYAGCIASWEQIKNRYNQVGKVQIEFQDITCEPILLSPHDERPVKGWSIRPTDSQGILYCYDEKEEEFAKQTWREVNADPNNHFSTGHLRNFLWDSELYGKVPEVPLSGFRGFIDTRLAEFKACYGALTPTVTFKVSDVMKELYGGDRFLTGWKITVKALQSQEGKPKKGLLDKLTNLL